MFIVHIAGNLGKDPESRFTASGLKVTTFSVAVNKRTKEKDETIWVRVTVWGDRFDKMLTYLKKGSSVIVTGRMNTPTTYTDKQGNVQVSLEIVAEMIEFSPFGKSDKPEGQHSSEGQSQPQYQKQQQSHAASPAYDEPFADQSSNQYGGYSSGQGKEDFFMEEDKIPF